MIGDDDLFSVVAALTGEPRLIVVLEKDARLVAWGYPYVYEDFRFHMTLTGRIADEAVRARVLSALQNHFAPETRLTTFDSITVFKQPDRSSPFTILARFDFIGDTTVAASQAR